jgi:hypothetical protein
MKRGDVYLRAAPEEIYQIAAFRFAIDNRQLAIGNIT